MALTLPPVDRLEAGNFVWAPFCIPLGREQYLQAIDNDNAHPRNPTRTAPVLLYDRTVHYHHKVRPALVTGRDRSQDTCVVSFLSTLGSSTLETSADGMYLAQVAINA